MKAGGKDNIIIDGNNLLYRIFWTSNFKIDESDSPGQIFLFLRALKSYVDKFQAKNVYCTWDKKLDWPSTNFRKEAAGVEYKAGRDDDKFKDVFEFLENIIEIIALLGVKNIYPKRMEADDVMAWLARTLPGQNVVVTTDKDLLQLVNNKITVYNPIKKKEVTLSNFQEYTGVQKEYYMSYRVVTGDKSDNIQGFPRFGLKRFLKLEHKIVTMDGQENVALIEGNSITEEQFEIYKRNWGLMNLSYLIKKNKKGNFIHYKIKGNGKMIAELEKNEKIDKNLLRYLTVKVNKFDLDTDYFKKNEEKET
mgnify:CR=1 FL=1